MISNYKTIFDYNVRNKTLERDYTFENYREDIALSLKYYELYSNYYLDQFDYIYIPPIGKKFSKVNIEKTLTPSTPVKMGRKLGTIKEK